MAHPEWMDRLLGTVAAVVGGLCLLGGAGYALDAAWTLGWIGPAHAAAVAMLCGTAALVGGDRLWHGRWQATAAALSGAGMGTLYLTLFLCYGTFGWLSGPLTGIGLFAVTAVGVLQALRRDSELMAVLGLLGGLLTPLALAGQGVPHLPYQLWVALLDVAVVVAVSHRRWRVLAWLAVAATALGWLGGLGFGASWVPVVVGATLVGCAFGVGALRHDDPSLARPLLAGTSLAQLAALGTLAGTPWAALVSTSALLAISQAVTARFGWTLAGRVLSVGQALALAGVGLFVALEGSAAQPGLLLALAGLPAASAWLTAATGRGGDAQPVLPFALAGATIAVTATVTSPDPALYPWLGLLLGLGGVAGATSWHDGRLRAREELVVIAPLCLAAGAGCVALGTGWATLPAAATLTAVSLLLPLTLDLDDDAPARLAPLLALPCTLAALWATFAAVAPGFGGVPPLLVGALAVAAQRLPATPPRLRAVYQALAVALAVLAVPLQLERAAWTIAWALLAAAVAWAGRQPGAPRRAADAVALSLTAAVALRLVANPAVLDYHLANHTPSWWVLYGYGAPLAALAAVERWVGRGRPAVQAALAGVAFAGVNLLVSQLFADGGTAQLVDMTLHARMARTVSWAGFGLGLVSLGRHRALWRPLGIVLLAAVTAKVLLLDLWALHGLARAGLLLGVAVPFLVVAGVLQRKPRQAAA